MDERVKRMVRQLCGSALFAGVALLTFAPGAHATVLPPGTCAGSGCVPPSYTDFGTGDFFGAPIVADTGIEPLTGKDVAGNTLFTGNFREIVLTDTVTSDLDFLYQVQRTGGTDPIGRVSTINYKPTLTDVGICSACSPAGDLLAAIGPSHVAPQFIGRGAAGDDIVFDFGGSSATQIGDSNESSVLVIRTNATNYTSGSSSVINGGTANVESFAPAAVPEPATAGLLLGPLAFVAYRFRAPRSRR